MFCKSQEEIRLIKSSTEVKSKTLTLKMIAVLKSKYVIEILRAKTKSNNQ